MKTGNFEDIYVSKILYSVQSEGETGAALHENRRLEDICVSKILHPVQSEGLLNA
jgi:hypothetical protein